MKFNGISWATLPTNMKSNLQKSASFPGNKSYLPEKPCVACGRAMTWRKKWAKNWNEVKFCSDRCRANFRPKA
jgi:hypothetical protein